MLISVIIPFYYGNEYLNKMIEMLNTNYMQLFNSTVSMEVILVNDSPEEKIDIREPVLFPMSIVINRKNQGIHITRVNGLRYCKGDYVLFLDQDDRIEDNYLLSQVDNIKGNDFSICGGWFLQQGGNKECIYKNIVHQKFCLDLDYHYGYSNPIVSPGQVLIKKSIVPTEWKQNFFINNGADDHYLWLLLLEQGYRGVINPENLYTHVSTGNNTSLNIEGMCASNFELISYLSGLTDSKKLNLLRRRTLYYNSNPKKLVTKLCFVDVGLIRKKYSKKINEGSEYELQ